MRGVGKTAERLLDWFDRERRDLPWRRTRDPYAIWVSEVMLQQTQVRTVVPYWERWMREFPDVRSLAEAPESRVLKLWEGLGYYRRARHLHAAAVWIRDRHGGRFPGELEAILELPGIGRYTAGAIASIAFGLGTPVVDGNVARVLTRWQAAGGDPARGSLRERLWGWAEALVMAAAAGGRPDGCGNLNQALMELGALVCTPREPACGRCPLSAECRARAGGEPERYPEAAARPSSVLRFGVVLVVEAGGRYWIRQRAAGGVNGGLWEFPNESVGSTDEPVASVVERVLGASGRGLPVEPLGEVQHSITRFRIRLRVFRIRWVGRGHPAGEWRRLEAMEELPFATAHRRILGWLRQPATRWEGSRGRVRPGRGRGVGLADAGGRRES